MEEGTVRKQALASSDVSVLSAAIQYAHDLTALWCCNMAVCLGFQSLLLYCSSFGGIQLELQSSVTHATSVFASGIVGFCWG